MRKIVVTDGAVTAERLREIVTEMRDGPVPDDPQISLTVPVTVPADAMIESASIREGWLHLKLRGEEEES